ncbi:Siderophore iron transporter 1 [Vanrija pseudolonga]|uniref:Siderophore iron transporter 1 n=1 Tax=Vanrija pseudolonga TaxID=143232 RepID=A0AAF0YG20_9TREE|nr:Siderophore iron transporter 1 [Vanrija pseudolonga]
MSTSTNLYPHVGEHAHTSEDERTVEDRVDDQDDSRKDVPYGVQHIEATVQTFSRVDYWILFVSIFLVAYARGFDNMSRTPYQAAALSSWGSAAQTSTLGVTRAVVSAATQPVYAKLSDFLGRPFVIMVFTVIYVVGCIVQATSKGFSNYLGGFVLYVLAFAGQQVTFAVLIADTTSTRSRVAFSLVPSLHITINAWVSGTIAQKIMAKSTWRWGFAIGSITVPILTIPLLATLLIGKHRAKRRGLLAGVPRLTTVMRSTSGWKDLFWRSDGIGLVLLAASLALMLIPLTLGGGSKSKWAQAQQIAPLAVGLVIALPAFLLWQWKGARHPIIPFRLLKERHVLCSFAISALSAIAASSQGSYLYYTLLVSFSRSVQSATRIQNIYSFVRTVGGLAVGFAIRKVPFLKPFIMAGGLAFILAYGLLYRYRGGHSDSDIAGLIAAETILGMAGALVYFPAQTALQVVVKHEHVATATALFTACFSVGSAIGSAMTGAIWTSMMPDRLLRGLEAAGVAQPAKLAKEVYGNPIGWINKYPVGTVERVAVEGAYREVQRYICISGLVAGAVMLAFSFGLYNPRLGDKQSLDDEQLDALGMGDRSRQPVHGLKPGDESIKK